MPGERSSADKREHEGKKKKRNKRKRRRKSFKRHYNSYFQSPARQFSSRALPPQPRETSCSPRHTVTSITARFLPSHQARDLPAKTTRHNAEINDALPSRRYSHINQPASSPNFHKARQTPRKE
ncbi:hypothetical protein E2C01_082380 [Portunus trituberculatus]|uniref:Uncharacterized protein n=1 Tax=Portunus trituberculatus TaxID=210409 RepID=A0A5B7J1H2_PORTR|nr:hypothetical protein [Portunus trituberculatus]